MDEQTLSTVANERLETLRKEAFYARIYQAHLRAFGERSLTTSK